MGETGKIYLFASLSLFPSLHVSGLRVSLSAFPWLSLKPNRAKVEFDHALGVALVWSR
jgi:hypothetical protein